MTRRDLRSEVRRRRDERGESLVELAIAVGIIALVLGMSVVILSVVVQTTTTGINEGQTADSVQTGLQSLSAYLTDMTTPQNAATASASYATPLTAASTCWGTENPQTGQAVTSGVEPQYMNVDFAWDFAMQFCAYPPGSNSSSPHVYEAFVNKSTCNSSNMCTLQVLDFGSAFASSQTTCDDATTCTMYPLQPQVTSGSTLAPQTTPAGTSSVVYSLHNVWCDSFCQSGVSCQTDLAESLSVAGCSSSTVNSTTPPIFNYYTQGTTVSTYPSAPCQSTVTSAPTSSYTCTMNLTAPSLDFLNQTGDALNLGTLASVALNISVEASSPGLGHPVSAAPVRLTDLIPVAGLS